MHLTVEFVMPQREKNFRRKPDIKLDVVAIIPDWVVLVVTMETDFLSVRTVGSITIIVHSDHHFLAIEVPDSTPFVYNYSTREFQKPSHNSL